MAKFQKANNNKKEDTKQVENTVKGTPRVTRCNLVNLENRPWLTAFVDTIFEGTMFLNSIAVREDKEGNAYITFPNKKRMVNGKEALDENGKPIYDAFYGPADKETRKRLEEAIFEAVQSKFDGEKVSEPAKGEDKVIINMVENTPGLVAFANVVFTGKFFMSGVTVNEVQSGENKGNIYLQFPSRKRTKNGQDVLDEHGKPIYDAYCGPATKQSNADLTEMVFNHVQKAITEAGQ